MQLLQENKRLKAELVKIEARLVRANSAFDTEDSSDVEEVMGSLAAVTERVCQNGVTVIIIYLIELDSR